MALKIRLARGGAKKRPFYRIVVADATAPRDGKFIERIGHYNPLLPHENPERIKFDAERVKYWLGHGAQPTERLARIFAKSDLVKFTQTERPHQSAPKKKAQERAAAAIKAAEAAAPPAENA
jgi:small subunit ribosomal protein S16